APPAHGDPAPHPPPPLELEQAALRHRPVDDRDAPEAPAASLEGVEQAGVVGAVAARLNDESSAHAVRPECLVEAGQRADLVRPRAVAGALDEREAGRLAHVRVT